MNTLKRKIAATLAYVGLMVLCLLSGNSFEGLCAFLLLGICGPLAVYGIWEET